MTARWLLVNTYEYPSTGPRGERRTMVALGRRWHWTITRPLRKATR